LPGEGASTHQAEVRAVARDRAIERRFGALLRRVLVQGEASRSERIGERMARTPSPLHDRRAPARQLLARHYGAPIPLLFDDRVPHVTRECGTAALYLDVSGSMDGLLPRVLASLVPLRRMLRADVWAFSNTVERLTHADLARRRVRTTGGTDIGPVLRHFSEVVRRHGIRRALVITDGYVGSAPADAVRELRESGGELHVAVVGGARIGPQPWAASIVHVDIPGEG
jgi:Mg-chelatase subunit ChlD